VSGPDDGFVVFLSKKKKVDPILRLLTVSARPNSSFIGLVVKIISDRQNSTVTLPVKPDNSFVGLFQKKTQMTPLTKKNILFGMVGITKRST